MNRTWTGSGARFLAVLGALVAGVAAEAGAGEHPGLYADRRGPEPRFGLEAGVGEDLALVFQQETDPGTPPEGGSGPAPFTAGLLSAIVPGTGQLVQGQQRGWLYLGVELASWFSYVALRSAADQSDRDAREFGSAHWDPARCPQPDPVEFEDECGWDSEANRLTYESMQDDANGLYQASDVVIGVVVLNHLVSAIDAAKSASNRRKAEAAQSLDWRVVPTRHGDLALRVELTRSF